MIDVILATFLQVAATLLLGVFFGLERRLKGWPGANSLHANAAAAGLIGMLALNPNFSSLLLTMALAVAMSFAIVGVVRSSLQLVAGEVDLFAAAGADVVSLGSAMSAGCACGTSDARAVAGVVIVFALVAMFRSDGRKPLDILQRGDVDAPRSEDRVQASPEDR